MSDSVRPTIHAERRALADDLASLTPEQWATRSLCSEVAVHEVLAHQVATAGLTPARFLTRLAGAGFDFDRFAAKQVAAESSGGPEATLAAEPRETAPPGPRVTWLGEALVHGEDIRRPLGIEHRYPLPEVARAIRFYAGSNALIGGRNRVAGLTLRATDTDLALGSGPVVEGPAVSLLLAVTGRSAALGELCGPGVARLAGRF